MVKRTIQTITSKISGLGEAAFWLSLFGLFSQILALFRDRLLAHNFGAGEELDIYYAAFKIPDLAFVTVASLVSISALVPLFAKKETEGERHLKDATDSIFTVFSVLIIVFCVAFSATFFGYTYVRECRRSGSTKHRSAKSPSLEGLFVCRVWYQGSGESSQI